MGDTILELVDQVWPKALTTKKIRIPPSHPALRGLTDGEEAEEEVLVLVKAID